MDVSLLSWTSSMPTWKVPPLPHPVHLDQLLLLHPPLLDQLLLLPQLDVEAQIGLVIIFAMMKTTMLNATLMVVIAVEMMSTHNIVLLVNVLRNPQKAVETHNGKVTTSVMMKTTMLDATDGGDCCGEDVNTTYCSD